MHEAVLMHAFKIREDQPRIFILNQIVNITSQNQNYQSKVIVSPSSPNQVGVYAKAGALFSSSLQEIQITVIIAYAA